MIIDPHTLINTDISGNKPLEGGTGLSKTADEMTVRSTTIGIVKQDITDMQVDAIVNAANSALKMGGGVAGAILRGGGSKIQDECDKIGYCPVGGAVITTGGNLKAKYVIHAVGPRYGEGNEDEKLRNATLNSLKLADKHKLKSIAFPAISTGIFGFPKERCAEIMLPTTRFYLRNQKTGLKQVIFCLYDQEAFAIFSSTLLKLSGE